MPIRRTMSPLHMHTNHIGPTSRLNVADLARRTGKARLFLALALTLLFSAVLARSVDRSGLAEAVGGLLSRPWLLAAFVGAFGAAFVFRAIAWRVLLKTPAPLPSLTRILHGVLFANHVLPISAGDVVRPYLAARRGIPMAEGAATTIVARMVDFTVLLVLSSLLMLWAATGAATAMKALLLPAACLLLGAAALLLPQAHRLPRLPWRLHLPFQALAAAVQEIGPRRIVSAAAWTLPSWALDGAVLYVASIAMGTGIPFHAAVAATAFTVLFQTFRFTPGGIGVYEATMAGALALYGVPLQEGLTLALLAHGLKFAYSLTVAPALVMIELRGPVSNPPGVVRGLRSDARKASAFEVAAARAWNIVNEGKPFTVVFTLAIILVLTFPSLSDGASALRAVGSLLGLSPLFLLFYRYDYPLRLRWTLWIALIPAAALFGSGSPQAVAVVLAAYFFFTVILWGSLYYHLRIGAPWTNFTRFWRMVIENPDPTSGNFLEQVPKVLLIVFLFQHLAADFSLPVVAGVEIFVGALAVATVLLHQWFFTWAPPVPLEPRRLPTSKHGRVASRVIVIVIDGCRADRLREARTPCIDRLRQEGTAFTDLRTVYPARTVTCFSSMLTGAGPKVHGMGSNFVPSLGVKCESVFGPLRAQGLKGKVVGIAHLIDAFGHDDVATVTAVMHNDEIDHALVARAKAVMEAEDPDLLVLHLISVDQAGHSRGSYNREYLEKIEQTDGIIDEFLGWCERTGRLADATVIITSDHGQGKGIGGHGHLTPPEAVVPGGLWGAGVDPGRVVDEQRSIIDIAPTISQLLGVAPPEMSAGRSLLSTVDDAAAPTAIIIPAYNEAEGLPAVLLALPRHSLQRPVVIVVDDGSTDSTAETATQHGADVVVRHARNLGLGAALRTGMREAVRLDCRAAVYIDADGEYDPADIPKVLEPVLDGTADYVLGSRYRGKCVGQRPVRYIGNKLLNAAVTVLSGRVISDGQTGLRAFSRRALECAEIVHNYNHAQVLTLDLLKKGMRLAQVPISYRTRKYGRSFIGPAYLWRVPTAMLREILTA